MPEDFRFSAKLSKAITHEQRLIDVEPLVQAFLGEVEQLGDKLAIILVQLPPSLGFDPAVAEPFFSLMRRRTEARLACEPRHPSWFEGDTDRLLESYRIARVAADPAKVPAAAVPGGWRSLSYYRLHGSPVPYRSSYGPERLQVYADGISADLAQGSEVWCIFDNTASSAAAGNALALQTLLRST